MEQVNPRTLLVDVNVRADARVDAPPVDSIRDLNLLQLMVGVRTAEGTMRVRYGHRRTLAAIEAGLRTVPATLLTRRITPKGTGQFLAGVLARDPGVVVAVGGNALAASLVAADIGSGQVRYGRSDGLAAAISTASESRALMLALAVVLASCEDIISSHAWRHLNPPARPT